MLKVISKSELLQRENMYALRGIVMLLIVLHHINHHIDIAFGCSLLGRILDELGYLSTGVFFLLSGYGLTKSIEKNSPITLKYCLTRVGKIFYTFVFAYCLCALGLALLGSDISFRDILIDIFTLSMPYSPTWFLKTIFCVYVVYFFVSSIISKKHGKLMTLLVIFLIYYIVAYQTLPYYYYVSFFNFFVGSLIAVNYDLVKKSKLIIFIASALLFMICFYLRWKTVACISFSCMAIVVFSFLDIKNSILKYIGINSLIFYLGQFLPLQMGKYITLSPVCYFILTYLITFGFAVSFVYVENVLDKARKY